MAKRNRLAAYLKRSRRTYAEFARAVDADRSQIYRCAKSLRRPGLELALRIERESGGAVPASSWAEPSPVEPPHV